MELQKVVIFLHWLCLVPVLLSYDNFYIETFIMRKRRSPHLTLWYIIYVSMCVSGSVACSEEKYSYLWQTIGVNMVKDSLCSCVIWKSSGTHMAAACMRAAVISVQNHPMYGDTLPSVCKGCSFSFQDCRKNLLPSLDLSGKTTILCFLICALYINTPNFLDWSNLWVDLKFQNPGWKCCALNPTVGCSHSNVMVTCFKLYWPIWHILCSRGMTLYLPVAI